MQQNRHSIHIRLPREIFEALKRAANENNESINCLINRVIKGVLDEEGKI